jgi:hypothetical protein
MRKCCSCSGRVKIFAVCYARGGSCRAGRTLTGRRRIISRALEALNLSQVRWADAVCNLIQSEHRKSIRDARAAPQIGAGFVVKSRV